MAITLRLVCCVAPYAVAGVRFGRGPSRAYGVIQRPIDQFSEADLHELFTEPRVDVSVGVPHETGGDWGGDWAFVPVSDALDLVRVRQLIEAAPAAETAPPPRGTIDILAEHARLEAERARDAAAPGGDDEDPDTASADPAAGADLPTAALADAQTTEAAAAPEAAAPKPPAPRRGRTRQPRRAGAAQSR